MVIDYLPPQTEVIVPIWGAKFWELFTEHVLPTTLTPENVRGLHRLRARWRIFCRPSEYYQYAKSSNCRRLMQDFRVEMVDLRPLENEKYSHQYELMTRCHQQAICEASNAMMFIQPDQIYSSNSFLNLAHLVSQGARAVMVQGLRLVREQFVRQVHDEAFSLDDLAPRKLMRLAMGMLHPITKAHLVVSTGNRSNGSYYWIDPTIGVLAHCIHLHPVFFWPNRRGGRIATTIDHELVRLSITERESIILVQDFDLILQCELSPRDYLSEYVEPMSIGLRGFAEWAKDWTNAMHRDFFLTPIWFRFAELDDTSDIEARAGNFARTLLAALTRQYGNIIGTDMAITRNFYSEKGTFCDEVPTI